MDACPIHLDIIRPHIYPRTLIYRVIHIITNTTHIHIITPHTYPHTHICIVIHTHKFQ